MFYASPLVLQMRKPSPREIKVQAQVHEANSSTGTATRVLIPTPLLDTSYPGWGFLTKFQTTASSRTETATKKKKGLNSHLHVRQGPAQQSPQNCCIINKLRWGRGAEVTATPKRAGNIGPVSQHDV